MWKMCRKQMKGKTGVSRAVEVTVREHCHLLTQGSSFNSGVMWSRLRFFKNKPCKIVTAINGKEGSWDSVQHAVRVWQLCDHFLNL